MPLILILSGGAHHAAVPVLPQSLLRAGVTADTGQVTSLYDMNAAFMSFQLHECGIHAVRPGAGGASVTKVCFRCAPRPMARRERTKINFS
jgi:hypothetical protein